MYITCILFLLWTGFDYFDRRRKKWRWVCYFKGIFEHMYFWWVSLNHFSLPHCWRTCCLLGFPHIRGPCATAKSMFTALVTLTCSCSGGLCSPVFVLLLDPTATWHQFWVIPVSPIWISWIWRKGHVLSLSLLLWCMSRPYLTAVDCTFPLWACYYSSIPLI